MRRGGGGGCAPPPYIHTVKVTIVQLYFSSLREEANRQFSLQFSTAVEWAGLLTCLYTCAASTAVTPEKRFNSALLHHALAGSAPWL